MKNASQGRVSSPSYKSMASMSRPAGRTSWTAGPLDADTDCKMANNTVKHDGVTGVARGTK